MTHIMIEDTPEGKWLVDLIRNHKSVTVMGEKDSNQAKTSAWDKAMAEGAVSLSEFGARFTEEISRAYKQ
ncbi:hypothetical protein A3BBH6_05670 [Alistipes onderdonkii subsp. vulgaris]|jgi:hypothetical protein|uniref:hypothetical protein n=1 Tax=Alistipes onderdonkii TaxID=328813 RepID=UPI0011446F4F|nr:hypothetical protein [Alistipes onderdonkii]BBL00331.1 hypothetical protein A3BBH6_05670 [Alistipes onderdonkii subsp. vulgaris]